MRASTSWGSGDRHVLLVHGLGSNKEGWWRVGPWFAERGWTAHAVDLAGHGGSPDVPSHSLDRFVDDLPERDGGWDLVLGHSLGGAVAIRALRDRGFAAAAVLVDPLVFLPDLAVSLPIAMAEFDIPAETSAQLEDNPTWHPEDARIKVEALQQSGPATVEAVMRGLEGLNLVEEVAGITVPTLLVGADLKALVPPELGAGIAAMSELVAFVSIPGSSHSIHRDEFQPLMAAIEDWLAGL